MTASSCRYICTGNSKIVFAMPCIIWTRPPLPGSKFEDAKDATAGSGSVAEQHVEDVVALLAAGLVEAGAVKEARSAAGAMPYPLTTQAPGWTPLATRCCASAGEAARPFTM